MIAAHTRLTIALDIISEIDRNTITPQAVELLQRAEACLTLIDQDMSGQGRDPEHEEYAKSLGVI